LFVNVTNFVLIHRFVDRLVTSSFLLLQLLRLLRLVYLLREVNKSAMATTGLRRCLPLTLTSLRRALLRRRW